MDRRRTPFSWLRDHPWHLDIGLTAVLAALSIVEPFATRNHLPSGTHQPNVWYVVLALVGTVPLVRRRRHPIPAMAVITAAVLMIQNLHLPDGTVTLAPVIAAYSVGAYIHSRRAFRITAAVVIGGLIALNTLGAIVHAKAADLGTAVGNGIVFGTAFLLGDNFRRRRQRIADLEARAAAEETTRDLLAREAVTAERQRIARELHDVVAHSLSVMVVQAGAARRLVNARPDQAIEALGHIETTGRSALDEMRRLLGVLRSAEAAPDLAPQPSVAHLPALVGADPTLAVDLVVEGDPVPLPASVDLQTYRIVQEALTNVRKHAGPANATVVLRYGADALDVRVDDDGRGASTRVDGHEPSGHGLTGMRERAALIGGELQAGPRPGGGWSVHARLPLARRAEGAA